MTSETKFIEIIPTETKIETVGDFEKFDSKSLNAFIVECNRDRSIFFVKDLKIAN